jgi:hypothetical protein
MRKANPYPSWKRVPKDFTPKEVFGAERLPEAIANSIEPVQEPEDLPELDEVYTALQLITSSSQGFFFPTPATARVSVPPHSSVAQNSFSAFRALLIKNDPLPRFGFGIAPSPSTAKFCYQWLIFRAAVSPFTNSFRLHTFCHAS